MSRDQTLSSSLAHDVGKREGVLGECVLFWVGHVGYWVAILGGEEDTGTFTCWVSIAASSTAEDGCLHLKGATGHPAAWINVGGSEAVGGPSSSDLTFSPRIHGMMNPTDRPTDSFVVETTNQSLGQIMSNRRFGQSHCR